MQSGGSLRPIVIPGEAVGGPGLKPGSGTFSDNGQIFAAQLGVRTERDGLVSVIPLAGRYIPQPGDAIVGEIVDFGPSHWLPPPPPPPPPPPTSPPRHRTVHEGGRCDPVPCPQRRRNQAGPAHDGGPRGAPPPGRHADGGLADES